MLSSIGLRSLWLQVGLSLAAVSLVIVYSFHDDGLGFQGDAPRHTANGALWQTLVAEPTLDSRLSPCGITRGIQR